MNGTHYPDVGFVTIIDPKFFNSLTLKHVVGGQQKTGAFLPYDGHSQAQEFLGKPSGQHFENGIGHLHGFLQLICYKNK